MAKLSTPYHQCDTSYVDKDGVRTGHKCPYPAYKSLGGRWLCRTHLRREKARQAPAFAVVGAIADPFAGIPNAHDEWNRRF